MASSNRPTGIPGGGRSAGLRPRRNSALGVPKLDTEFLDSSTGTPSLLGSSRSSVSQQPSADACRKPGSGYPNTEHSPWSPVYSAPISPLYSSSYAHHVPSHVSHGQYYSVSSSHSPAFTTPLLSSQPEAAGRKHDDSPSSHYSRQSDGGQEALKPVTPTWFGWVEFTEDALKLIEACISYRLKRIQRRPDENERPRIIQNGAVFVYDETTTGILRWTDDRHWSPSRVRGSFMLYRELDSKVPPGEKKKALKRQKLSSSELGMPAHRSIGDKSRREDESSVRGSHTDSYPYKMEQGLMKRTFSAYYGETKWSVISYYDPDTVEAGMLLKVSEDPNLRDLQPRQEIVGKVLQGSGSTPKGERQGSFSSHYRPSTPRDYEHAFNLPHRPATSSYSEPRMTEVSAGHMSYPPSMQHGTGSYDQSPITPVFQQPSSYGGPPQQLHGQSFPLPQTQQYGVDFQYSQSEQHSHMYHPIAAQHQPVMDPRSYQERTTQEDRRDSPTHFSYAPRAQYRQLSYHHEQPSGFSSTRPDGQHLDEQQQQQQQQFYGAWHAHDQKYFPAPPGARPN